MFQDLATRRFFVSKHFFHTEMFPETLYKIKSILILYNVSGNIFEHNKCFGNKKIDYATHENIFMRWNKNIFLFPSHEIFCFNRPVSPQLKTASGSSCAQGLIFALLNKRMMSLKLYVLYNFGNATTPPPSVRTSWIIIYDIIVISLLLLLSSFAKCVNKDMQQCSFIN